MIGRMILASVVALLTTANAASAAAGKCTRIALSEVAFGAQNATRDARRQLDEYARDVATKRGWPKDAKLVKSSETVTCSVYLQLPLATEYRCLVTATFCTK